MDAEGQLRNLRDFLLVYNRMTEICFQRCSTNFNYRNLTMDEERCADSCAGKLIRSNHRLMGTYVKLMPAMVQRRMEEMESKAAEVAKASEEATLSSVTPELPLSSTSPLEVPTAATGPDHGVPVVSDLTSVPAAASNGTAAPQVSLTTESRTNVADP